MIEQIRTFSFQDQLQFAELSGDYNPLHIDPLYSRRLLYGEVVVHGINALFRIIDKWLQKISRPLTMRSIETFFVSPIFLKKSIRINFEDPFKSPLQIKLICDETVALESNIVWEPIFNIDDKNYLRIKPPRLGIKRITADNAAIESGKIKLYFDKKKFKNQYPFIGKFLPSSHSAGLLALSRLVGMKCPGLNSVFSELKIEFNNDIKSTDELLYETMSFDRRFSLLVIGIKSDLLSGRVKAFLRPEPVTQISFKKALELVDKNEFNDQFALIIGGSRGLGEVAAKLLSAGGAHAAISYFNGENEIREIVDEIMNGGGSAEFFRYDVLKASMDQIPIPKNKIQNVVFYYFATPPIFAGKKGRFKAELFQRFCAYYLFGFQKTFDICTQSNLNISKIFYPSTIAIEELPLNMVEYAAAKSAGEIVCKMIAKSSRHIKIYTPRLPRLETDQTVSLFPVNNQDPVKELLKHCRYLVTM